MAICQEEMQQLSKSTPLSSFQMFAHIEYIHTFLSFIIIFCPHVFLSLKDEEGGEYDSCHNSCL